MNRTRWIVLVVAVLLVVAGVLILLVTSPGPKPKSSHPFTGCLPDPAAAIAALPAHGTFDGTGNCYITHGITIYKPVTINGGKYEDPDNSVPPQTTHGAVPLPPIFKVFDTDNVTIENVRLIGANATGVFDAALVNNAGIDVLSSHKVTLSNDKVSNVFGDGAEFWTIQPNLHGASTDVTVSNYTANVDIGRIGMAIIWVEGGTFTNIVAKSFSFETDEGPGTGSGNITVEGCTVRSLINIPNYLSGPITFDHCTGSGQIIVESSRISPIGDQPVTISNSQLATPAQSPGTPPGSIYLSGGVLNLTADTFTRMQGVVTGPAYYCTSGSTLNITNTTFVGRAGVKQPGCKLTVG